jgi:uncharacterized protein (DUF1684 family)
MLATAMDAKEHERIVLAWRKARQERLRAPSGWLTLVDRVPLDEGDNQLPFGTVNIRGETATLGERTLHDDDAITHEGKVYELSQRGEEFAVRVKDPSAPARVTFAGLSYFPIDLAWRVTARFERYQPPRSTQHQYDTGAGPPRLVPGAAHFSVAGHSLALEPVLEEQSRRLYFLFGDETNRTETYPAGRFLYADMPAGASDDVTLDFNMAFNPPCVFTAYASCPVLPAHSRLPVRIAAGEKRWPDAPA